MKLPTSIPRVYPDQPGRKIFLDLKTGGERDCSWEGQLLNYFPATEVEAGRWFNFEATGLKMANRIRQNPRPCAEKK